MKKEKQQEDYKVCKFCGKAYKASRKYCPRCMRDDSGEYHGYKPISDEKARKIRWITGAILIVVLIAVYVIIKTV